MGTFAAKRLSSFGIILLILCFGWDFCPSQFLYLLIWVIFGGEFPDFQGLLEETSKSRVTNLPIYWRNQNIQMYGNFEWSGHNSAFVWVGVIFFRDPRKLHIDLLSDSRLENPIVFGKCWPTMAGYFGQPNFRTLQLTGILAVIGPSFIPKAFHKAPNPTRCFGVFRSRPKTWGRWIRFKETW